MGASRFVEPASWIAAITRKTTGLADDLALAPDLGSLAQPAKRIFDRINSSGLIVTLIAIL